MRHYLTHCFCCRTFEPSVASNVQRSWESRLPTRGFDRCFCLERGFFGGQHETSLYPGRTHAGIVSQPEVLCGPAAFWTYYLRSFWSPIVLICASVKLNLQGEISPPRCYSSCGCRGLPVILSLIQVIFLCWFLASLRQMASTQVSHQQSPLIWITSLSQLGR